MLNFVAPLIAPSPLTLLSAAGRIHRGFLRCIDSYSNHRHLGRQVEKVVSLARSELDVEIEIDTTGFELADPSRHLVKDDVSVGTIRYGVKNHLARSWGQARPYSYFTRWNDVPPAEFEAAHYRQPEKVTEISSSETVGLLGLG